MSERTIRGRGTAKVSESPDWVVISFEINSRSLEYEECVNQLAAKTERLREDLASVGLGRESLKTSRFDVNTDFHWDRRQEQYIFRGYKASHNLCVEFAFEKDYLNKALQSLSRSQSEASFHLSFTMEDPEPLRQQALVRAVENCRVKARALAGAAGVSLGEIMQMDYSWSEIRFEHRDELMTLESAAPSSADYSMTPEDVDISESVTAIWAIG